MQSIFNQNKIENPLTYTISPEIVAEVQNTINDDISPYEGYSETQVKEAIAFYLASKVEEFLAEPSHFSHIYEIRKYL